MPTTALTTKLRALLAQIGPMGLNGAVEKKLAKVFVAKDADPVSVADALVDLALESPSQNVRWTVGWLAGPVLVRALGPGEHVKLSVSLAAFESTFDRR